MRKKATVPAMFTSPADHNTLKLDRDPEQSDAAQTASMALGAVAANAMTAHTFDSWTFGKPDITACATTLKRRADTKRRGDLQHAETTLTAQAATLDAIFKEMTKRAAPNMGERGVRNG